MEYYLSGWVRGIINAGFAAVILWIYFGIFLQERKAKLRFLAWLPFLSWHILWTRMTVSSYHFPFIVNSVINLTCVSVLAASAYRGSLQRKLGLATAYVGIDVLAEVSVWFALSLLFTQEEIGGMWWGSVASRAVTVAAIAVLHHFFKRTGRLETDGRYSTYLLIVPLGSIFVVHMIFRAYERQGGGVELLYAAVGGLVMLGVNALVFALHYDTCNIFKLEQENRLFAYQAKAYKKYQKEQEAKSMEECRIRHDRRKKLVYLQELARQGKCEDIIRLTESELQEEEQENKKIIQTQNPVVDALVNDEYRTALRTGVRFTTEIHIPGSLPVDDLDLCIILGNLLDNAQEATERKNTQNPYIFVSMLCDRGNLIIHVENSYAGTVQQRADGSYMTSKADKQNHGIGLGNVARAVEKNHGVMNTEKDGQRFCVDIVLYEGELPISPKTC